MTADAIAMFHVADEGLEARLLERLQQPPTGAGLIAWRLYEQFPSSARDDARCAHLARMVYGVLGDLADAVIGCEPGVWVVPDDEASTLPTTLDEVRKRGVCLTRAHAGTPEQRAADSSFEVDAMTRMARVLEKLAPGASTDQQVRDVLSAFSAEERARLDALAVREGAASFSAQVLQTLAAARPGSRAVFEAKAGDASRVAEHLAAGQFDGLEGQVQAWARVNQVLDGLGPSLGIDDKVREVLRALSPPERAALDAMAAEEGLPSFAVQLKQLLLG